jgi:glutaredoxin 2
MIRIVDQKNVGVLLKETTDALKDNLQAVEQYSAQAAADKIDQMKIMEEIKALEHKVEEVTQILCKTTLSYMVRFQLKDDLEYYHEIIERKKKMLAS